MTLSSPKWSSYYNDIVITNAPEWRQGWDSQTLSPLLLSGEEQGASHSMVMLILIVGMFMMMLMLSNYFSPMTWASHSCRDWKGNLLPQPIPQTHSCVPFVGDKGNVDVDDDDGDDDDDDTDLILPWCVGTILHPSLLPSSLQELT